MILMIPKMIFSQKLMHKINYLILLVEIQKLHKKQWQSSFHFLQLQLSVCLQDYKEMEK